MKTMKFLSMAALTLVGAMMTGCSSSDDDSIIDNPQQPVNTSKTVTLTTTVSMDGGASTRALTAEGVKTFAAGETMAVIYNNGTSTVKAVSHTLEAGDLIDGGRSATFTFDLETPDKGVAVTYIYPAAMANSDGSINYAALNSQNGTLATLASTLDLATYSGDWNGASLPIATLANQLAILAITRKNADGSSEITSAITGMTVSDGTNSYAVSPSSLSTIYVAIQPVSDAAIEIAATDGTNDYTKSLAGKTYAAGNGYNVSWRMTEVNIVDLSTLKNDYVAQSGDVLTGTLGESHQISIAAGATVTLDNVSINADGNWLDDYAGISCQGNATIILKDGTTNTVKGFWDDYPGIHVPSGSTLTIQGSGSLTASSNGLGAGIGGGKGISCGNIIIQGGTIVANGGNNAAGIGGGRNASCGDITITTGVTSVTANCTGYQKTLSIGAGTDGNCGTVTIGGTQYYDGSNYPNNGYSYLNTHPLVYNPSVTPSSGDEDDNVITWGTSELSQIDIYHNTGGRTINDIRLALGNPTPGVITNTDEYVYWDSGYQYLKVYSAQYSVKFTAPSGKKFTKIEITIAGGNHISYTGWTNDVWTGSSSTVTVSGTFNVTSIEFTLEDDSSTDPIIVIP